MQPLMHAVPKSDRAEVYVFFSPRSLIRRNRECSQLLMIDINHLASSASRIVIVQTKVLTCHTQGFLTDPVSSSRQRLCLIKLSKRQKSERHCSCAPRKTVNCILRVNRPDL